MKRNRGFTLMEMLIVVAIIAVLAAIAIPVFNGSLHKAKVAADMANACGRITRNCRHSTSPPENT